MALPHIGLSLTPALAVYGAVLSTLTAAIQASNHFRDRAKVRITVRKNMKPTFPDRRYHGMTVTIITATNVGRRPVRIDGFAAALLFEKGREATDWLLSDVRPPIPCEITEGRTVSAFLNQTDVNFDSVSHWYAWDSAGRHHRLNVSPWHRRWVSRLRYRWAPGKAPERPSPALGNDLTKAQVLDALQALQRGEDVGQRILAYLAAKQFIVVEDVTNHDSPRGQKEYLFSNFTEKGQRLLES